MVDRGLLLKEWRQHQTILLIISLITIIGYPLYILTQYTNYRVCVRETFGSVDSSCYFSLDPSLLQMFFVAGIILAIIQLGIERNKGILDFSFGLPFHRRTIFRSKVFIGALVIWGSQFISFVISLCLIAILRPDVGSFYSEYLMSTLTCFMLYMLMLAAGTMTGSVIAQLMVGLSASILPMLLFLLIYAHFEMIFRNHTSTSLFQSISTLVSYVTPLFYVSREFIRNPMIILPLILTGLFYWIGIICFDKLPNEREGYFFLLEKMNKPIQLLVIAIGLLGFGLFGYAVTNSLFGYFIGMVIGAIIGFFLSYFLIFKKSKLF